MIFQGSSAAPRTTYPGAPPPAPIKGSQRPTMTSPAGGIAGAAPYRGGANWTQGYPAPQQPYRYSAPLPQPTYATYTPHTTQTSVSEPISLFSYAFSAISGIFFCIFEFSSYILKM